MARAEIRDEEPRGSAQPALASERDTNKAASTFEAEKNVVKEIFVCEHVRSRDVFLWWRWW